MARKPAGTLTAIARKDWEPATERPFARIGLAHLVVCAVTEDLRTDDVDAAELAHRWNSYPHLVAALERITSGKVRNAVDAANEALAHIKKGTA